MHFEKSDDVVFWLMVVESLGCEALKDEEDVLIEDEDKDEDGTVDECSRSRGEDRVYIH